jgi:hypothetical protein
MDIILVPIVGIPEECEGVKIDLKAQTNVKWPEFPDMVSTISHHHFISNFEGDN